MDGPYGKRPRARLATTRLSLRVRGCVTSGPGPTSPRVSSPSPSEGAAGDADGRPSPCRITITIIVTVRYHVESVRYGIHIDARPFGTAYTIHVVPMGPPSPLHSTVTR